MTGTYFYILTNGSKVTGLEKIRNILTKGLSVSQTYIGRLDLLLKNNAMLYKQLLTTLNQEVIFDFPDRSVCKQLVPYYSVRSNSFKLTSGLVENLGLYTIDGKITTMDEMLTVVRTGLYLYGLEILVAKMSLEALASGSFIEANYFNKDTFKLYYNKLIKIPYPNVKLKYSTSDNTPNVFIIEPTPTIGSKLTLDTDQIVKYQMYLKKLLKIRKL